MMKTTRMNFYKALFFGLSFLFFIGCIGNRKHKEESGNTTIRNATNENNDEIKFADKANSVFLVQTFDGNRLLETGNCFLISKSTIVAPFSLFKGANRAEIAPINGGQKTIITKYFTFDRINNIILLQVDSLDSKILNLYKGSETEGLKTFVIGLKNNNIQPIFSAACQQTKIVEGRKLLSISNIIGSKIQGVPIFVSTGEIIGMGISMEISNERSNFAIPATEILELFNKKPNNSKKLSTIGTPNEKKIASIQQILLETNYGNIVIKLFNETPAYRNNFVQLAEEGYFNNLLIHRVIRDFGIQTGAADTRYALDDDIVGWKGPGYTIPSHIVKGLYHKRGAIGSPRKPDTKNMERRSDGSQFYIVTGRKYLDEELDDIELENEIKFTPEQREVYKTIGGAPHLDGSYTIFGEVISGLEIADKITLMPVKGDFRPTIDIRLKLVKIIY